VAQTTPMVYNGSRAHAIMLKNMVTSARSPTAQTAKIRALEPQREDATYLVLPKIPSAKVKI
jgi:hypothetical protein